MIFLRKKQLINTILTSTANSIVNVYWRGKNAGKKRY